jgi:hypothetical protein
MLTCYGHSVRLPQSDLAYLAFRLAVQETISDIELHLDLEEEPDPPTGYLIEVPFLEQVPLPVQVDLLAETWDRHRASDCVEATLLDAAVVYAACMTAARVINDMPEVAVATLRDGPRDVDVRILKRASARLEDMFERFWDDRDFLLIDEWQDLPPDHARRIKELMRLPDEVIEPMYEALQRWGASPEVSVRLEGLMTEAEIAEALPLLKGDAWPPRPKPEDDVVEEGNWDTGIEDHYHDLLVGPCDPATAAEAECPWVWEVSVSSRKDFDCTYEEWVEHLRDDVLRAAEEKPPEPSPPPTEDADIAARVQQAMTTGLTDGTKIQRRGDGWVVVDSFYSYLADPEDASWVTDPDDEDVPLAVFQSPEDACRAWERSEEVAAARAKRREMALKRLGRR